MNSDEYFQRLSKVKNIPTIPETAHKLDKALENPDSSMAWLVKSMAIREQHDREKALRAAEKALALANAANNKELAEKIEEMIKLY